MVRVHHATPYFVGPGDGTGRRAGFKIRCRKACRFESDPGYQVKHFASLAQFGPEHLSTKQGVARSNRARRATTWKHSLNGKDPDSKSVGASDRNPGSSPGTSAIQLLDDTTLVGCAPVLKTGDWRKLVGVRLLYCPPRYIGCIAQLAERWSPKPEVVGSIPTAPAINISGKLAEWLRHRFAKPGFSNGSSSSHLLLPAVSNF